MKHILGAFGYGWFEMRRVLDGSCPARVVHHFYVPHPASFSELGWSATGGRQRASSLHAPVGRLGLFRHGLVLFGSRHGPLMYKAGRSLPGSITSMTMVLELPGHNP